ncbi:hypothetical protein [Streptomyces sp. NBC_00212]|uniref:hypothetical protein n=1 Tax=Streptomyces sp. NBC_00212 TaxID=2975684 RepID=UPI00324E822C
MRGTCTGDPHSRWCDHLSEEDLPAFEQALQQALESAEIQQALSASGGVITAGQLHALAWEAQESIAAAAAAEYHGLLRLRRTDVSASTSDQLPAVLAVLVPALAAIAAAVFLFFGYGLHLASSQPQLAGEFQAMGWICAAVAGTGLLADVIWLMATAVRNRPTAAATTRTAAPAEPDGGDALKVWRQAQHWQRSLLVRGIMPFLRARVEEARNMGTTTH